MRLFRIDHEEFRGEIENLVLDTDLLHRKRARMSFVGKDSGTNLVGKSLGHFSQNIRCQLTDTIGVFTDQPEDRRTCSGYGHLIDHADDLLDDLAVLRWLRRERRMRAVTRTDDRLH